MNAPVLFPQAFGLQYALLDHRLGGSYSPRTRLPFSVKISVSSSFCM